MSSLFEAMMHAEWVMLMNHGSLLFEKSDLLLDYFAGNLPAFLYSEVPGPGTVLGEEAEGPTMPVQDSLYARPLSGTGMRAYKVKAWFEEHRKRQMPKGWLLGISKVYSN